MNSFLFGKCYRLLISHRRRYVLYCLYMTRCNTVISIKARTSYGTHLLQNGAALLAHYRFDQENILTHINAIHNGLFPGVFTDDVLVKSDATLGMSGIMTPSSPSALSTIG